MKRVLALFLLLALAGAARATQEPAWNGESYGLYQGERKSGRIRFLVPSGPCESAAERLAKVLEAEGVYAPAEKDDERAMRVLVGTPDEPELEPLARACGVEPIPGGFRVLERDYREPGDAAVAVYEDPEASGRPLCLVLGNDRELVASYLDGIPRLSHPYLWVHADGELALECPLGPGGRPRVHEARDYLARRTEYFATGPSLELERFVVRAHAQPDEEQWRAYLTGLAMARERVTTWLEAEEPPVVELLLYEHLEDFEHCVGASALSVANRLHPRVHVLLAPGMPDDGGAGMARVLARAIAGTPAEAWIEDGLAVAAAGRWWRRPLDRWVGRLTRGRLLPKPEELLPALASRSTSEHVLLPARGFYFLKAAQVAGRQPGGVRAIWKGAAVGDARVGMRYQSDAQEASKRKGAPAGEKPAGGRRARAARAGETESKGAEVTEPEDEEAGPEAGAAEAGGARKRAAGERVGPGGDSGAGFRRGLALLESAPSSYAARAVGEALDEAQELGIGPNAISLTVFACAEDPRPPACTLSPRGVHGSTSDLALASAAAAAREREMSVLVALEVLAGPSGSWADNVSWTGEADTLAFFERYGRVAQHYALLSDLLQVEAFAFGANLREVSRTDPRAEVRDPTLFEQRRAGWKELIARVRAAFSGMLTYSFRFPFEGQESGFLDQLDAVGVSLYARVAQPGKVPSDEELRRNLRFELQQALDLSVRWNKPLVLVQLGFPARAESWATPTVPRGAFDPLAQQRFYEALADVLAGKLENGAMLRGYYLWNWPVGALDAATPEGGFALRGQPAESALRRLFER